MNETLVIKEIKDGMKGLFTKKSFVNGIKVLELDGTYFPYPTRTSIQIGEQHLEHYEGGHINHHCDPNTKVIVPNFTPPFLVAIKDIEFDEEITFNYETTETELIAPFQCDCHGNWILGNRREN
jgi:hypothetical protein